MPVLEVSVVKEQAVSALLAAGVPEDHARVQVELLVDAELMGLPSHGLLRLDRIVRRIRNGVTDPRARGTHHWRRPAFLSVDGQRGLGPVVALAAIDEAVARVKETGIAIVAIANSNHIGMLAWYVQHVAAGGHLAIALSTSEALVHPWGARAPMIGTNPIAIGVPTDTIPFVMDLATGIVSMGKIHDHARRGESIPAHWALDEQGHATTDAEAAKRGSIAPFGEAKGYALGLSFELLVASLTQSALGTDIRGTLDDESVCNKGDVFIIADVVQTGFTRYLDSIRNSAPAAGFDSVRIPGDRARATRAERLSNGIPIADETWSRVTALASAQNKGGDLNA